FRGGGAANRASSSSGVTTNLDLAVENAGGRTWAHQQENEIRGIAPELQPGAATFKSHHRWGAPNTVECLTAPACHHPASVTPSEADCKLQDRRQDYDAIRFVENALRNAVRSVQNFLQDFPRVFDAIGFFVLRPSG